MWLQTSNLETSNLMQKYIKLNLRWLECMHIKNDEVTHMLKVDTLKLPCKCVNNNPYYPWIHIWKRDTHGYKGRYPSNTRRIFWGWSCRDWKRVAHRWVGGNRWYSVVVMGWRASSYDMGILCHYFLIHSSILFLGCSPWKPTLTLLVVFLKWFLHIAYV